MHTTQDSEVGDTTDGRPGGVAWTRRGKTASKPDGAAKYRRMDTGTWFCPTALGAVGPHVIWSGMVSARAAPNPLPSLRLLEASHATSFGGHIPVNSVLHSMWTLFSLLHVLACVLGMFLMGWEQGCMDGCWNVVGRGPRHLMAATPSLECVCRLVSIHRTPTVHACCVG